MSKARAKGTWAENGAARKLWRWFNKVERRALHGINDKGDLVNAGPYCVSVKHHKAWRVFPWLDELAAQTRNSSSDYGFIMARRPNRPGFVYILPEATFTHLMDAAYGSPAPSNEERPTP